MSETVAYRGVEEQYQFDSFVDEARGIHGSKVGLGFFFTDKISTAWKFAGDEGRVLCVKLDLGKTYVTQHVGDLQSEYLEWQSQDRYYKEFDDLDQHEKVTIRRRLLEGTGDPNKVKERNIRLWLQGRGYDSVRIDYPGRKDYVVFDPSRVHVTEVVTPQVARAMEMSMKPSKERVLSNLSALKTSVEATSEDDVPPLVSQFLWIRDAAHKFHLATDSYSKHIALGDFYESWLDKFDEFIETFYGQYGGAQIEFDNARPDIATEGELEFIASVAVWLKDNRSLLSPTDYHLQNIWDELTALSYRTKYKIQFLK